MKIKIYSFLAAIFWFIRQFIFPNPFNALGEGITVCIGENHLLLSPELLNWFADPVIGAVTFLIVGIYYVSGTNPTLGSGLYMLFYAIHIGLMFLMLLVYPTVWLMILIGIIYIGLHVAFFIWYTIKSMNANCFDY